MREVETPGPRGRFFGAGREENGEKVRRPGRMLVVFKALVLLALVGVTAYGIVRDGLYDDELWLPVAAGVLGLLFVTLFSRSFYRNLPPAGLLMVGLLAALVLVKGCSMIWTISETETIKETLRASMYPAAFVVALAAFTSARQIGPFADVCNLVVGAVAGYGLLQKVYPEDYEVGSVDGYRVDSTLAYPNTAAVLLGMGVALGLARMTASRNVLVRGLYAALVLASLVTLYLTLSRGGVGSLGIGLAVLFALGNDRLQMLANLLLVAIPGAWLFWRMQDLTALLDADAAAGQKVADGLAFRNDLVLALVVAFVLQAAFAFAASRYELTERAGRYLGVAVGAAGAVLAVVFAVVVVAGYGGIGQAARATFSNPDEEGNAAQRLVSLGVGFRAEYWRVAWDTWLERPLTGTGAGTFQYTWLENRSGIQGVKQVHNLYLEQGTETGLFAFLALVGFVVVLLGYTARAARRAEGENRLLLAGLVAALAIYLVSSIFEWHWYLPASTLFFFLLAAAATWLASREDPAGAKPPDREPDRGPDRGADEAPPA